MGKQRQRYNEEFKKQTVKYIQEQTKTLSDVAEDLNIPKSTLSQWMTKYRQFDQESVNHPEKIRNLEQTLQTNEAEQRRKDREIEDLKEEFGYPKKGAAHLQQGKELRFQFIEEYRSDFRVEKMCQVLQVSRSGYYKWRLSNAI